MTILLYLGVVYLFIDAIASLLAFHKQPVYCQLVRVGRFAVAVLFLIDVMS